MVLGRVRKNVTLCCCNRLDSCMSPLSASHIQQRFISLFLHHEVVMLRCWLHGIYSEMLFPFFTHVGYLLKCIPVTMSNAVCPTPLKTQFSEIVSMAG